MEAVIHETRDLATDELFMQFISDAVKVLDNLYDGKAPGTAKQTLRLASKVFADVHLDLEQRIEKLDLHVIVMERVLAEHGYMAEWGNSLGYAIVDTES